MTVAALIAAGVLLAAQIPLALLTGWLIAGRHAPTKEGRR